MLTLAYKRFIRSAGVKIGLLLLLVAGLTSLLVGNQFLNRQRKNAAEISTYQRQEIARNVQYHPDEIGLLLYYVRFSLVNQTVPLNGLSIGQRDVNPSIQSVTIRALEAQKYDADLNNPTNLLLGNLDFSFVLIYLFPLLIISFGYNLLSDEKERGTWTMVAVQSQHLFSLIRQLFLIRISLIVSVLLILLMGAVLALSIPPDVAFWAFGATAVLYLLFWFAVCFWVVSLHKKSSVNALLLLAIWVGLLIVLPAGVNNYLISSYPVPEALATTISQRKGYHEKWDMPQKTTVDKFYAHYPQFSTYPLPNKTFSWLWYYAMQQMGDDESAKQAGELRQKLGQRDAASRAIARFIPTLHTQLQLNELAKAGLGNQIRFLDETTRFHERKRLYFYPRIFSNAPVLAQRWDAHPVETFSDNSPTDYPQLFAPLLLAVGLFGGLGWRNFRRNLYQL